MSLADHLDALRTHLLRGGKWFLLAFVVCFLARDTVLEIVMGPHTRAMSALGLPARLQFLAYQEPFIVSLKLAIFGGLFLGLPMLLREIWQFVSVGLYPTEKSVIRLVTPLVTLCFTLGVLFGYFVLVPIALRFLATYGDPELVSTSIRLEYYTSLFLTLTLALGLVFQLPLVMWALARIGMLDVEKYKRWRRYAILGGVITAAFLTPPDVITQLLMAGPLIVLYEIGILLVGGLEETLRRGRFLAIVALVLVIGGGLLTWDLFRVDWAIERLGGPDHELTWTGGGDRPYAHEATGAARELLELAERSAAPLAARARAAAELVPLAVTAATAAGAGGELREFLRECASDERGFVRDQVARALGAAGSPEDGDVLAQLHGDPDRAVRVTAAVALLARNVPAGAFTLISTLESGPGELAAQARAALVEARGADSSDQAEWWSWYFARQAEWPQGDRRNLVAILERLLGQELKPVERSRLLAELPAASFRQLVEDDDPHVRARAAALVPLAYLALLHPLASDPDPTVRLAAGLRLAEARDYKAIPILVDLVGHPQRAISLSALAALAKNTGLDLPERRDSWETWWRENEPTFRW